MNRQLVEHQSFVVGGRRSRRAHACGDSSTSPSSDDVTMGAKDAVSTKQYMIVKEVRTQSVSLVYFFA